MANRYSGRDYAAYIAVRIAIFVASILPLGLALWAGRIIGLCMYCLHPKRKKIAYANLKAAFCKDKTSAELKAILRRVYKNYGQTIMETLRMPRVDFAYLEKHVKVEGQNRIPGAQAKSRGVIFLTSHFGNWEFSSLKSAQEGYPIYVLARPQRLERLNDLLNSFREKLGCRVIDRGMHSRQIIKALKKNCIVGVLSDQDAGKDGIFMELLGRPASYPVGAVRLARDTGATILPTFIIRQRGGEHLIRIEEPITVTKTDDRDADIREGLRIYTKVLESYIRQYPDQWMWVYTRWKSTPLRKVVILNDGKSGHLNQSLAALDVIKRCRRDAGFKDEDTSVEVIDVKFRNRIRRSALSLCVHFSSHACQGCMGCLKFSLVEDSYRRLMRTYADIVISCGSALAPVNIFLSKENNAKNVLIMKPGIVGLRNFDVAIIPEHDRPKEKENIVVTEGSPNLINGESMKDGGDRIRSMINLTKKRRLGLLIGGDNPEYTFTAGLAGELIDQVEGLLEGLDMELLATTSRRTPKGVEELLKKRLGTNSRCKLLLIANEKNIENAVSGILDLSEFVLTSGESISMISEAASSGRHTIIFDLEKKRNVSKHDGFIKRLASLGYIVRAPVDRIRETVVELSQKKGSVKRLNDAEKMYEKLYRII